MTTPPLQIRQIEQLPDGFAELASRAQAEGFTMLTRLAEAFAQGTNRFDRPGEALYAGWLDEKLVAIGGINIDPYFTDEKIGRIRHLYIDPTLRGQGIGRAMMRVIEEGGFKHFRQLQLFTPTEAASKFYVAIGYQAVNDVERVSHIK